LAQYRGQNKGGILNGCYSVQGKTMNRRKNVSTGNKNEGNSEKKKSMKSRRLIESRNRCMLIFLQVIASTKEVEDYRECFCKLHN